MGIFQHKQPDEDIEAEGALHFFDDYFREELRTRGREYFEKVIDDNATLLKKDLDATVANVDAELKEHVTNQLDAAVAQISTKITEQIESQFVEYGKAMKDAQDQGLQSLNQKAQALQEQHQQLSSTLQKSISNQEVMLAGVFNKNMARITATTEAQDAALQSLNQTVQMLQQQSQQMMQALQANVASQETMLVNVFEQNMAQIIEHYLLGALGDQYDLKAQLPSIIKQMEANKEAIVDDMKL
jgi:predicted phage tail protein